MTDYHTKTFYRQQSSITLTSPSKSAPYVFLSCINRKEDGTWEKTSEKKSEDRDIHVEGEYGVFSEHILARDGLQVVETTEFGISKETIEIKSKIKVESPKALLITLESDKEFWIPKSTIHSKYDVENKKKLQTFIVDKWIIDKQRILK